jgi:CRP/FNR family transcriptional regulator
LTCIADLPIDDLGEFEACGVSGLYKPRQVIFHQGTSANGLYVLCHGTVKLYQSDRFGREFIIDFVTPGTVLGELGLDDDEAYSASAEALTESQLSFLPRERLVQFIERHPKTAVRLVATLSKALGGARRKAGELALKRADARLAELLLRFADDANRDGAAGNGPTRIRLTYSRRELAEMIGVSTETAIRLLGKFTRNRMIAMYAAPQPPGSHPACRDAPARPSAAARTSSPARVARNSSACTPARQRSARCSGSSTGHRPWARRRHR